jgi:glycosyltransferase involved in cell wall biosynthesis
LILVNDGSSDRTEEIALAAVSRHSWITLINRTDRGFRQNGAGVVSAFYDGYQVIEKEAWDFLVKLDGDLSFTEHYFARCFKKFDEVPRLGIGGGTCCIATPSGPAVEFPGDPSFHVRGATKIYRRACWDQIGGLLRDAGWDTVDEVKANMLGWRTYTFRDIPLIHHRKTGDADGSWKNWVKNGKAGYIVGYHPLFMLAKCVKRVSKKPHFVASAGLMYGYVTGYFERKPCIQEPEVIEYLHRQQIRRLCFRSSIWAD